MGNMLAGALAGITEHTVTYPLDSIKTRLQIDKPSTLRGAYRSIRDIKGYSQLYRGVGSVIAGAGPSHAVYFGVYEECKNFLLTDDRKASENPIYISMAGALATASSDFLMTPFDVIKQRMQIQKFPSTTLFRSVYECANRIIAREGWKALYVSYPTTLMLNVPFHGIQFPIYEKIRSFFHDSEDYNDSEGDDKSSSSLSSTQTSNNYIPWGHLIGGGVAGGVAGMITTPIDVVKTTLQTRNIHKTKISGFCCATSYVWRSHGFTGFWRGVIPRTLSHMPASALCWLVYEHIKWLNNK